MVRSAVVLIGVALIAGPAGQSPDALPREAAVIAAALRNAHTRPPADTIWIARLGGKASDRDFRLEPPYFSPVRSPRLAALADHYNQLLDSSVLLADVPGMAHAVLLDAVRPTEPPAQGLNLFTRPAFNATGDSALVGHRFLCPGLCGSTRVLLLYRQDSAWVVVRVVKDLNY